MNARTILTAATLLATATAGYTAEPYRIGILLSRTGSAEPLGREAMIGIRIAHRLRPTVLDRPVEIIVADGKSDPSHAACGMYRLVERNRVSAIIGDVTSSCTLACSGPAERMRIPLLSLAGPLSRAKSGGGYTRWMGISAEDQGTRVSKMCWERLRARTAAILQDNSEEYSVAVSNEFEKTFVRLGGAIVYRSGLCAGQYYVGKQLEEMKRLRPDVLFVPLSAIQCGFVAKQARDMGLNATIVATDRAEHEELITTGGKAVEGLYLISQVPHSGPRAYLKSKSPELYVSNPGKLCVSRRIAAARAYCLLLDAVEQAQSFDGESVLGAIKKEQLKLRDADLDRGKTVLGSAVFRTVEHGRFEDVAGAN